MDQPTAKSGFRQLNADDVELGQPLRWSLHNDQGQLLLARGSVVRTENQRNRLLSQRVLVPLSPDEIAARRGAAAIPADDINRTYRQKGVDVFGWLDAHYELLATSYGLLGEGPSTDAVAGIRRLAVALQKAAEQNSEGLLAAVFLCREDRSYALGKAFHVALFCNALARVSGVNAETRLSLIAAGLTHDVAMWQMQDQIQLREAPLSDAQWSVIRAHCAAGVELLKQSGVRDPIWLTAVGQHHERLNGSGYHLGITDAQIEPVARIMAIADVFAAMVRIRGDRDKRVPKEAMRQIFMTRGDEIDSTLVQLFIKKIGMFAPGCMLRLVNGEIGVATGASSNAASPDVAVIIDSNNQPLARSVYRDTASRGFAVQEFVSEVDHPQLQELLATWWNPVPITL